MPEFDEVAPKKKRGRPSKQAIRDELERQFSPRFVAFVEQDFGDISKLTKDQLGEAVARVQREKRGRW